MRTAQQVGALHRAILFHCISHAGYAAEPLTYRRGNSHSSWSGQWVGAPVCYQLTSTLSMCVSHDHHGTLTNAVHLLKTSVVAIANLADYQPILSHLMVGSSIACKQKQ